MSDYSQLEKGNWLIGADFINEYSEFNGSDDLTLSWSFLGQRFISDRWSVGGQVANALVVTNGFSGVFNSLQIVPSARYYLQDPGGYKNFFLTAETGVEINTSSGLDRWALGVGAGGDWMLQPDLALEGLFSYRISFNDPDITVHDLRLDWRLRPFIGGAKETPLAGATSRRGMRLLGGVRAAASMRAFQSQANIRLFFSPTAAYFVSNRLALGGEFEIDYLNRGGGGGYLVSYRVRPGARFYLTEQAAKSLQWFLEGQMGIAGFENKFSDEQSFSDDSLELSASAGGNLFLSSSVALEGALNYTNFRLNEENTTRYRIGFDVGVQVFMFESQK